MAEAQTFTEVARPPVEGDSSEASVRLVQEANATPLPSGDQRQAPELPDGFADSQSLLADLESTAPTDTKDPPELGSSGSTDGPVGSDGREVDESERESSPEIEEPSRESELARLKEVYPQLPDALVTSMVDTADELRNAPAGETSEIMTKAFESWKKDFPDAELTPMTRAFNDAITRGDINSNLSLHVYDPVGIAALARKGEEGREPIGVAFVGETRDSQQGDRLVFDTLEHVGQRREKLIEGVDPETRDDFTRKLDQFTAQINDSGGFKNLPDLPARKPAEGAPGLEEQEKLLSEDFDFIIGKDGSDGLAAEMVRIANRLAFAEPKDMQSILSQETQAIKTGYPDLKGPEFANMLSFAMNNATGESGNQFAVVNVYDQGRATGMFKIRDRRLREATAFGVIGDGITEKAFEGAFGTAQMIRDASRLYDRLPGDYKGHFDALLNGTNTVLKSLGR